MSTLPTKVKYLLGMLAAIILLTCVIAEWRFSAIRSAPRFDRSTLTQNANLLIVVQPDKAPHFIQSVAQEFTGYSIPEWALKHTMPYEIGMIFTENPEKGAVDIQAYGSLRRFSNGIRAIDKSSSLSTFENRIAWEPNTLTSPNRGLLLATGSIESDFDAQEQIVLQWGNSRQLVPKSISGDHLWELLFDNRSGKAYLSMASMMTAFDYKFTEKNMGILLSSIQFIKVMRAYADITEDDILSIAIDIDIVPEARNRIGVVNMKGAIDEGFAELGKHLNENYNIQVEGSSNWNEFTIEFRYTIDHATRFVTEYLPQSTADTP